MEKEIKNNASETAKLAIRQIEELLRQQMERAERLAEFS